MQGSVIKYAQFDDLPCYFSVNRKMKILVGNLAVVLGTTLVDASKCCILFLWYSIDNATAAYSTKGTIVGNDFFDFFLASKDGSFGKNSLLSNTASRMDIP